MRHAAFLLALALSVGACASDETPADPAPSRATAKPAPETPAPEAAKPDTTPAPAVIPSGIEGVQPIQVEGVLEGTGPRAEPGQRVVFHYTGTLLDGTKFDSSRDSGQPFAFTLGKGRVIQAWDLVAARMRVGDRWVVTIPPELAYGERGVGPIPGNATLVFDMEFVGIR